MYVLLLFLIFDIKLLIFSFYSLLMCIQWCKYPSKYYLSCNPEILIVQYFNYYLVLNTFSTFHSNFNFDPWVIEKSCQISNDTGFFSYPYFMISDLIIFWSENVFCMPHILWNLLRSELLWFSMNVWKKYGFSYCWVQWFLYKYSTKLILFKYFKFSCLTYCLLKDMCCNLLFW